jgi:hypothetical protein
MPVTGQFLSVPVLFAPDNVPEKYKEDYLSAEQNKASAIPPPALASKFMGESDRLCRRLLISLAARQGCGEKTIPNATPS